VTSQDERAVAPRVSSSNDLAQRALTVFELAEVALLPFAFFAYARMTQVAFRRSPVILVLRAADDTVTVFLTPSDFRMAVTI
jgi:hypothetical protein